MLHTSERLPSRVHLSPRRRPSRAPLMALPYPILHCLSRRRRAAPHRAPPGSGAHRRGYRTALAGVLREIREEAGSHMQVRPWGVVPVQTCHCDA